VVLEGTRVEHHVMEPVVGPFVVGPSGGQCGAQGTDGVVGPSPAIAEGCAEELELLFERAYAQAEGQPAPGHLVQGAVPLGDGQWVV